MPEVAATKLKLAFIAMAAVLGDAGHAATGNPATLGPLGPCALGSRRASRSGRTRSPDSREVTIVWGTFSTLYGEKFDPEKLKIPPVGSFHAEPAVNNEAVISRAALPAAVLLPECREVSCGKAKTRHRQKHHGQHQARQRGRG